VAPLTDHGLAPLSDHGLAPIIRSRSGSNVAVNDNRSTDLPRTSFAVTYNRSGAKLTAPGVVVFLGHLCDAQSPQYGNGSWGWANGGTRVTFTDGRAIGFPRQVLSELVDRSRGGCAL
jgi:hypothetical protein